MGASALSVVWRFVTIYLKWVLLANVIAWPLSWLIMNRWLENFAYRSDLSIRIFLTAAITGILISTITISWHAWNVARANPVNSLRYE